MTPQRLVQDYICINVLPYKGCNFLCDGCMAGSSCWLMCDGLCSTSLSQSAAMSHRLLCRCVLCGMNQLDQTNNGQLHVLLLLLLLIWPRHWH